MERENMDGPEIPDGGGNTENLDVNEPQPTKAGDTVERLRRAGERREQRATIQEGQVPQQDRIKIKSPLAPGGEIEISVPSDDQKMVWMRDILNRLEVTKEPLGGPAAETDIRTLGQIISALVTEARPIGIEMYREYQARLAFHTAFLAFERAGGAEDIQGLVQTIRAEHLNTLFKTPEFVTALDYYEGRARDYIIADQPGKDVFRKEVQQMLAGRYGGEPRDYSWAQNLGERFWQFSGRMVMHDRAVPAKASSDDEKALLNKLIGEKGEEEGKKQFDKIQESSGKYEFIGDVSGGNWALRRILKFKDFLQTNIRAMRPNIRLLDFPYTVDLRAGDYFSASLFSSDEIKKHVKNGMELESQKNGESRLNFSAINWEDVDFRAVGEVPMFDWAYGRVAQPDKVRDALVGNSESFLRNPNNNSLFKLIDVFDYQRDRKWETKKNLFLNWIEFAKTARNEETGKPKYHYTEIIANLKDMLGIVDPNKAPFLHPKQDQPGIMEELNKRIPLWQRVINRTGVKATYSFILNFILGLAQYFAKQMTQILSGK